MSPHPDDAVLSAWHVLTRADVCDVVTVFTGTPDPGSPLSSWDRLTGAADPAARAAEREIEDAAALGRAGCAPVPLGFLGSSHRRGRPADGEALRESIAAAVVLADVVWIPAGIGGHPDHVAARDAALVASAGTRRVLYADLPYAARFGWPPWAGGELDIESWLHAQLDGLALVDARVHRLDQEHAARKREAIRDYRTQFAALAAGSADNFPDGPSWAYEMTWDVR
ncbi:PIG-L family deacetylase [Acrocarpospora phusangensis]|uniref:PIG-L family deacetylase n=1 Tax=Acrocarpospora phusangensis TaxID=1070424 RepID=UPI00194E5763|nr:PIG-L family deacetylase [Acrocarpospora phusangensis]